ncbi:unnamed protein product [Schistosoma margrebowiei]|uniref:Uncharacterized protein n=1 Tax=Schistosoma margrebowiei TaxID=48269 RepID=A0A183L9D0_9TREM|nr:unnamed protein product [Schistosoma margrebowiei]
MIIRQIKSGKAAGPDDIPAEALKADVVVTTRILHILFNKIWDKEQVPTQHLKLKTTVCQPTPKKKYHLNENEFVSEDPNGISSINQFPKGIFNKEGSMVGDDVDDEDEDDHYDDNNEVSSIISISTQRMQHNSLNSHQNKHDVIQYVLGDPQTMLNHLTKKIKQKIPQLSNKNIMDNTKTNKVSMEKLNNLTKPQQQHTTTSSSSTSLNEKSIKEQSKKELKHKHLDNVKTNEVSIENFNNLTTPQQQRQQHTTTTNSSSTSTSLNGKSIKRLSKKDLKPKHMDNVKTNEVPLENLYNLTPPPPPPQQQHTTTSTSTSLNEKSIKGLPKKELKPKHDDKQHKDKISKKTISSINKSNKFHKEIDEDKLKRKKTKQSNIHKQIINNELINKTITKSNKNDPTIQREHNTIELLDPIHDKDNTIKQTDDLINKDLSIETIDTSIKNDLNIHEDHHTIEILDPIKSIESIHYPINITMATIDHINIPLETKNQYIENDFKGLKILNNNILHYIDLIDNNHKQIDYVIEKENKDKTLESNHDNNLDHNVYPIIKENGIQTDQEPNVISISNVDHPNEISSKQIHHIEKITRDYLDHNYKNKLRTIHNDQNRSIQKKDCTNYEQSEYESSSETFSSYPTYSSIYHNDDYKCESIQCHHNQPYHDHHHDHDHHDHYSIHHNCILSDMMKSPQLYPCYCKYNEWNNSSKRLKQLNTNPLKHERGCYYGNSCKQDYYNKYRYSYLKRYLSPQTIRLLKKELKYRLPFRDRHCLKRNEYCQCTTSYLPSKEYDTSSMNLNQLTHYNIPSNSFNTIQQLPFINNIVNPMNIPSWYSLNVPMMITQPRFIIRHIPVPMIIPQCSPRTIQLMNSYPLSTINPYVYSNDITSNISQPIHYDLPYYQYT